MKICIVLLSCFSCSALAQQADWIRKPKEQWPQIAMINEVWYKNGERYIHPSFEYAATGFLRSEINKNGIDAGLKRFKILKGDSENLFKYDLSAEKLSELGEDLVKNKKLDWAIAIYKLSLSEYQLSGTYAKLGKAYLAKGQKKKAKEVYEKAIELWSENEEALEALKILK